MGKQIFKILLSNNQTITEKSTLRQKTIKVLEFQEFDKNRLIEMAW